MTIEQARDVMLAIDYLISVRLHNMKPRAEKIDEEQPRQWLRDALAGAPAQVSGVSSFDGVLTKGEYRTVGYDGQGSAILERIDAEVTGRTR